MNKPPLFVRVNFGPVIDTVDDAIVVKLPLLTIEVVLLVSVLNESSNVINPLLVIVLYKVFVLPLMTEDVVVLDK